MDNLITELLLAALMSRDFLAVSDATNVITSDVEVCIMAVDADRAVLDQLVKACVERGQGVTKVVVRGGKRWLQEIMQMEGEPSAVVITKTIDTKL